MADLTFNVGVGTGGRNYPRQSGTQGGQLGLRDWLELLLGGAQVGLGAAAAATAPGGGKLRTQRQRIPPVLRALRDMRARFVARNFNARPTSFLDYVAAGGRPESPYEPVGMTPYEATRLGLTTRSGLPVDFYDPATQTALTPAQHLFLAREARRRGDKAPQSPVAVLGRRLAKTELALQKPDIGDKRRRRLEKRQERLAERWQTFSDIFGV